MEAALNQPTFLTQAQALLDKVISEHTTQRNAEVQSIARWSMSPQEAGDGLESIVKFQVQIKGHSQREHEDKWQGCQNWTDDKLATKRTKDDDQPFLLLPARWWPDTLPEF